MTDEASTLLHGTEHSAADDLQAVVRVLEQRCRAYQDQIHLGEQGRRQADVQLRQQIQVDIAVQHQREAEAAYQPVRASAGRVAAQLRQDGGPRSEQLAANLEAIVRPDAQQAAELGPRLVWLLGAAHRPHRAASSAPGSSVGRGVALVRAALVPLALSAPIVTGVTLRAADADWAATAHELDAIWQRDWPRTSALLDGFLGRWPGHGAVEDKLYGALVPDGQARIMAAQGREGVLPGSCPSTAKVS